MRLAGWCDGSRRRRFPVDRMKGIPTRRSIARRAGARIWQALEDHKWLPLAFSCVLLLITNF